jgi:predicted Zn-dependent peptidase
VANGAKIAVERKSGDKVAVSVLFSGGAQRDPPALHGRAALLATLAATSCRKYPADLLTRRLKEMDATLEPLVESEYWGVVLVAPKKWWRKAIEICTSCAFRPSFERGDLASARLRLLEKFGKTATPFRLASHAAFLISPTSPGSIAPWGSRDSLTEISLGELTDLFRGSAKGEAVTIAAIGDLPVDEATRRIARRVAHLPPGSLSRYEPPSDSKPTLLASWSRDSRTRAVVAWRVKGSAIGGQGATAFVLQMRNRLANMPGIEPVWHDAAARGWGTWAAIALRVSEEALPTLKQTVDRATRMISFKDLSEVVDETVERDRVASLIAAAQLKYAVEQLAKKLRKKTVESRSRKAALEVARQLLASPARFAICRPRRK